jgi:hypothetical protein
MVTLHPGIRVIPAYFAVPFWRAGTILSSSILCSRIPQM